jgi:hypothetical protein
MWGPPCMNGEFRVPAFEMPTVLVDRVWKESLMFWRGLFEAFQQVHEPLMCVRLSKDKLLAFALGADACS